jgi:hypothetical protein
MIEQLYLDFTTKLLPQLQSGLTLTKDYFVDLFGRYTNYLITVDSILTGVGLFLTGIGILFGIKFRNWIKNSELFCVWFFITLMFAVFGLGIFGESLNNLIKDIYIPEIRILEIIKQYK